MKKLYGRTVNVDNFYKYRFYSKNCINWFKYKELTTFLTCTGLRKNEVRNLKGNTLTSKNGNYYIHVTVGSKGGRERYAKIIGTKEEREEIIKIMKSANGKKVFSRIPNNYSYHILRSIYACRFIDMAASNTENISEKYKYHFKGEARGYCIDKRGMKEISNSLGHNRIDVIKNYFRKCLFRRTFGLCGLEITKNVYDLLKTGNKFV